MVDESLAQTSNTLFNAAFILYIAAMAGYFFRLAFTRVSVQGVTSSTAAGTRIGWLATGLAVCGWWLHLGSVVTRGLAAARVPWGNMYEYSSMMALFTVAVGLVVVQRRLGYGHLMGFVLAAGVLMMTSALLLFAEAGPLVPALNSYWIRIHTSAAVLASAIFMVGFAATALYLVKDTAERRVAATDAYGGSTVGAGALTAKTAETEPPHQEGDGAAPEGPPVGGYQEGDGAAPEGPPVGGYQEGDGAAPEGPPVGGYQEGDGAAPEGPPISGLDGHDDDGLDEGTASPFSQRAALSPIVFPLLPALVVSGFTIWVWRSPTAAVTAGGVAALIGAASWYAVPYLPPAAKLDSLAYRTIAFAFPIWTFAVMAGAIWAEEAWGRYWGWDPKETGAFFTWVLYAAYLHARSTHGWRGRGAACIGVVAFTALMVTYFVVNLFVVGFHSYAGVS